MSDSIEENCVLPVENPACMSSHRNFRSKIYLDYSEINISCNITHT